MYSKIMVPVDLTHADRLERALQLASDLAHLYKAEVIFVGVTSPQPSKVAHNPQEFSAKLDEFASGQAAKHSITASGHAVVSHDPAVDLDKTLIKACSDTGAELIVMASHVPSVSDYLFHAHGGRVAEKAPVSVLVVRES
ncbi:universal stress protein [Leisingera caerulea]|uniref:Universal stress protein n=1 Tax=Leisingera caerulea TaxID=506591 RepID=A0A9Q9HDJ0_LEICA|nr:universal stress protein [Leisingera caerulea]UWQ48248.1 universal stress protein [Leisingera caerulea]UWQ52301.1 universal stress protein [Leisingera caerulea]